MKPLFDKAGLHRVLKLAGDAHQRGDARQAKAHFDDVIDQCGRLTAAHGVEALDVLFSALDADIASADFELAHHRLRLAYAIAARLPARTHEAQHLRVQRQHLHLASAEGRYDVAAAMSRRALDARFLLRLPPVVSGFYALDVAIFFRSLGLLDMGLALLDFIEQKLLPSDHFDRVELMLGVSHVRVGMCAKLTGQSWGSLCPFGWDTVPLARASDILARALQTQAELAPVARELKSDAYALVAELSNEMYSPRRRWTPALRQAFLAKKMDELHKLGFASLHWAHKLEITGTHITDGSTAAAWAGLQQLKESAPDKTTTFPSGEEWQWQAHICLAKAGMADAAMAALSTCAHLANDRRKVASAVMADAIRQGPVLWYARPDPGSSRSSRAAVRLAESAPTIDFHAAGDAGHAAGPGVSATAHASPMPEVPRTEADPQATVRQRLEALSVHATSVGELASNLGITPRRLQQLFKAHGLPPPGRYLRQLHGRPVSDADGAPEAP